jgi:hypothetical protein
MVRIRVAGDERLLGVEEDVRSVVGRSRVERVEGAVAVDRARRDQRRRRVEALVEVRRGVGIGRDQRLLGVEEDALAVGRGAGEGSGRCGARGVTSAVRANRDSLEHAVVGVRRCRDAERKRCGERPDDHADPCLLHI